MVTREKPAVDWGFRLFLVILVFGLAMVLLIVMIGKEIEKESQSIAQGDEGILMPTYNSQDVYALVEYDATAELSCWSNTDAQQKDFDHPFFYNFNGETHIEYFADARVEVPILQPSTYYGIEERLNNTQKWSCYVRLFTPKHPVNIHVFDEGHEQIHTYDKYYTIEVDCQRQDAKIPQSFQCNYPERIDGIMYDEMQRAYKEALQ